MLTRPMDQCGARGSKKKKKKKLKEDSLAFPLEYLSYDYSVSFVCLFWGLFAFVFEKTGKVFV